MPDDMKRSDIFRIRKHAAVRRVASRGGCDLCGEKVESDVHDGELQEVEGDSAIEAAASASPLFQRHRDGTLCSAEDCKRPHMGAPEVE